MKPSDFYTVPRSEEGVRLALLTPDGLDSGEWLQIRGTDSRAWAIASQQLLQRAGEIGGIEDVGERERLATIINAEIAAPLIADWSFTEPLTLDAATDLLVNAPLIASQVLQVARQRSRFFGPGSPNSTPGPVSSEPSTAEVERPSNVGSESRKRARRSSPTSSGTGGNSDLAA